LIFSAQSYCSTTRVQENRAGAKWWKSEKPVTKLITIKLSEAEAEIILEALDTDRDIYLQSARDAVAEGSHDLAVAFGSAADRICAFRARLCRELEAPRVRQ
jgi:hypothetical protein